MGSISGLGRSPGVGNGKPLQYSFLGNPMDRGDLRAIVHGVTEGSDTTEQLNNCHLGSYGSSMPLGIKVDSLGFAIYIYFVSESPRT